MLPSTKWISPTSLRLRILREPDFRPCQRTWTISGRPISERLPLTPRGPVLVARCSSICLTLAMRRSLLAGFPMKSRTPSSKARWGSLRVWRRVRMTQGMSLPQGCLRASVSRAKPSWPASSSSLITTSISPPSSMRAACSALRATLMRKPCWTMRSSRTVVSSGSGSTRRAVRRSPRRRPLMSSPVIASLKRSTRLGSKIASL